jgi:hypothetical protein
MRLSIGCRANSRFDSFEDGWRARSLDPALVIAIASWYSCAFGIGATLQITKLIQRSVCYEVKEEQNRI